MAITTGLSTHQSEPLMTNNVTLGAVVVSTTGLIITVHRLTIFTGFARNQWNGSSVSHILKSYLFRGPKKCDCCSLQLWKRSNRHCNLCDFVVHGFLHSPLLLVIMQACLLGHSLSILQPSSSTTGSGTKQIIHC